MSDAAEAELIRREKIDILVDLSLHMAKNRMLVFARKPAPVQVTYLAYASTSGLEAMDYRFTDAQIDPAGEEAHYVEESIRLKSYWCFQPIGIRRQVMPLPAAERAVCVTFGCLRIISRR